MRNKMLRHIGDTSEMKYITSQKMREIDKLTQEEFGIPAIILMENAGRMASQVALDMLSKSKKGKVICICGRGNNGGDGFVCARHLINNSIDTDIFLLGNPRHSESGYQAKSRSHIEELLM